MAAGASNVFVPFNALTGDSHVTVTLTSDPGGRSVRWVERIAGSGLRIHLSDVPPPRRIETSLTYLVVEPHS